MSEIKKRIIFSLFLLAIINLFNQSYPCVVKANIDEFQNSNVNALINLLKIINKESYVDRYNNTTAYIISIDGYGNKQEIEFNYINNQVLSIKDINDTMRLSEEESINEYEYDENGLLIKINTPDTTYDYNYSENGVLLSQKICYSNGTNIDYLYINDKISSVSVNNIPVANYHYTNELLTQYTDLRTNVNYTL